MSISYPTPSTQLALEDLEQELRTLDEELKRIIPLRNRRFEVFKLVSHLRAVLKMPLYDKSKDPFEQFNPRHKKAKTTK